MKNLFNSIKRFDYGSTTAIILYFALLKLFLHLIFNTGYGYFRDEFYYIACGENLDFGYVDHPPLIAIVARLSTSFIGESLLAIRLLPSLAGAATVFITGLIVQELGGSKFALVIAGIAVIFSPILLALSGILSMNSFDIMFWTSLFYILILIIKNDNEKLWIHFGFVAGIALLNKISILFFGFGLFWGLILTSHRKYFLSKYFWAGTTIAVLIFLPHIIWQIVHGWPTLEFISNASTNKIAETSAVDFILNHFLDLHPTSVILLITGLFFFFFKPDKKKYRILVIIYLSVLLLLIFRNSKAYYVAAFNPLLIAMGAVALVTFLENKLKKWSKYAIVVFIVPGYLWSVPLVLPVLEVEDYIRYADFFGITPSTEEKKEIGLLPQFYADRFGWSEIVDAVNEAYNKLSDEEKSKALIYGQNYGEAGAVDFLGKKYNLPRAISGHNNYWLWGYPENYSGEVLIVIGSTRESCLEFYESVEHASTAVNIYAMPYENNLPVFICRNLIVSPVDLWKHVKNFN